jgi:hypothetical protein
VSNTYLDDSIHGRRSLLSIGKQDRAVSAGSFRDDLEGEPQEAAAGRYL